MADPEGTRRNGNVGSTSSRRNAIMKVLRLVFINGESMEWSNAQVAYGYRR
ncbi:MAG: hypothetical protein QW782_04295 [Candidatus Bathyarchaeia archaeon]